MQPPPPAKNGHQMPPPWASTVPKCYVHDDHYAAGFCHQCARFVCFPCGMAHQAAHARVN
jgi:hypothetical protein